MVRATVFSLLLTLISTSAEAEPFKVGVIIALTGPAAANGIAMRNAIELARQDSPDNFRDVTFVYEDGAFDSKQALSAFMKLRDFDKVNLIYAWGITYCKPIAPVAEASKTPVICQGIEQDSYINNKYLIRFMNSTDQYTKLLLTYIRSKKWHNIGMVVTENPYMEGMLEALQRNASDGESITIIDRYPTGIVDMSSSVSKLRQSKLDAVGVFLAPGQIGQFYKLMARQKVTLPSFGTNCFENADEIALSDGTMEGAAYVHNEVRPSFLKRYETVYGNQSQLAFGAMAYEFGSLVGRLFHDAPMNVSAEETIKRFVEVHPQDGQATGRFTFVREANGDRYFNFPMAAKEVTGTTFKIVDLQQHNSSND